MCDVLKHVWMGSLDGQGFVTPSRKMSWNVLNVQEVQVSILQLLQVR